MIVFSKDREPQAVATSETSQELVAAVAIPKITPYAQSSVQADFGASSELMRHTKRRFKFGIIDGFLSFACVGALASAVNLCAAMIGSTHP